MLELKLDRLSKNYRNKVAVDQVSYTFRQGVYGLLGANGAGKTTMLRMICSILEPAAGEVLWGESPVDRMGREYRRQLGYLPQDFGYYPEFTAWRYMMYLASLKALPRETAKERVEEMLSLVGLEQDRKRKIKTFSGGMIRRLGIAQALLNDPGILILDEPTSGLDPKERIRFRNIISSLSKNRIVILSTHIVSDVEFIADHILLMKRGKLANAGNMEDILRPVVGRVWECAVPAAQADSYTERFAVSNLRNVGSEVYLRIVSEERPTPDAVKAVPNLEDGYLYYFDESCEVIAGAAEKQEGNCNEKVSGKAGRK